MPTKQSAAPRGLQEEQFKALLNSSKAYSGGKRAVDLRKEIALKTHKNKQAERRQLFLSKLQAPPSPTAATTPVTPPESPAIFHYTLPSPGLVSPLALFESLGDKREGVQPGWVEQVDFRLPGAGKAKHSKPHGVPSLDQITARFVPQSANHDLIAIAEPPRQRPSLGVGRLRLPLRVAQPAPAVAEVSLQNTNSIMAPKSPRQLVPEIRITTLVVPRSNTTSPVDLTETNLHAFNAREEYRTQRAHNMLAKLKRRTLSSECLFTNPTYNDQAQDYKWKRRSAPADLLLQRPRIGFEHPVLALPGGF
jgi:hypothetical protein